jgi:hypothetical protein
LAFIRWRGGGGTVIELEEIDIKGSFSGNNGDVVIDLVSKRAIDRRGREVADVAIVSPPLKWPRV